VVPPAVGGCRVRSGHATRRPVTGPRRGSLERGEDRGEQWDPVEGPSARRLSRRPSPAAGRPTAVP
jgi:hypothetical protein